MTNVKFPLMCSLSFILSCTAIVDSYYISPNKLIWSDANDYCQRYCNSELASIHNTLNLQSVMEIHSSTITINTSYGTNNIWIGLSLNSSNLNTYNWIDSTTFNFNNIQINSNITNTINTSTCFSIDINSNYDWIQTNCNQHNRFMCNHCNGKLNKYLMINTKLNYSNAQNFCIQQAMNSSLASIHSYDDHQNTKFLVGYDQSWHTYIGLNDLEVEGNFTWTDGTTLDYGKLPESYGKSPWRMEEPKISDTERCVALYQEQRWWNDISCNDGTAHIHTFLCNMPSEICFEDNWYIYNNSWKTQMCNAETIDNGLMLLTRKEFVNTNGVLVIEYMYSMNKWVENGESGIKIYGYNGNICDFYYFSISSNLVASLIKYEHGKTYLLKTVDIKNITYVFGDYYRLKITAENMTYFTIQLNDNFIINRFYDISSKFSSAQSNQFKSGFIGLYSENINITAKSLFISGSPIATNITDTAVDLTLCPTAAPTTLPTVTPTALTNIYGILIIITFKYDTTNISNISTLHNTLINITKQIISNAIISLNNSECSHHTDVYITENHDQNDNTMTMNSSLLVCNEYVHDELLKMNETLKNNFINAVNNETTLKLATDDIIVYLESNEISSNLITTSSFISTDNRLSTNFLKIPTNDDSDNDLVWMFGFIFIGMAIMGLICCVIYLILYIKKNEIILTDKRIKMRNSVVNSIKINQVSVDSFSPKISQNVSSSDNNFDSEMKRDHESYSLSIINETSVRSQNFYRERTVGNSLYIDRVLLKNDIAVIPSNVQIKDDNLQNDDDDNESLFDENEKQSEETEGVIHTTQFSKT